MAEKERGDLDAAHDALNRMRRAHERGTGCRLTPEMMHALGCSMIGQMWEEDDPRASSPQEGNEG